MTLLLSFVIGIGGHTALPLVKPQPLHKVETYEITAYTANCKGCSGVTSSGLNLHTHPDARVVACPPDIELGTWLEIESVGKRQCLDRGGAIKGRRIDLFIPSLKKALEFGRQELEVEVVQ